MSEDNQATDIAVIKNTLTFVQAQLSSIDLKLSSQYTPIERTTALESRVNLLYRILLSLLFLIVSGIAAAFFKAVIK